MKETLKQELTHDNFADAGLIASLIMKASLIKNYVDATVAWCAEKNGKLICNCCTLILMIQLELVLSIKLVLVI